MAEDTKNVKFHEEVQKMEYEPLDATELKLIHWSWALGVFLLVALYFLSDFIAPGRPRLSRRRREGRTELFTGVPKDSRGAHTPLRLAVAADARVSHSERLPGDSSFGKAQGEPGPLRVLRISPHRINGTHHGPLQSPLHRGFRRESQDSQRADCRSPFVSGRAGTVHALACRRGLRAEPGLCPTSRRQPLPYGGVGSFSCWGELILGKEGFNAVCGVPPFFPIPRIS